jgi:hypothetical protein
VWGSARDCSAVEESKKHTKDKRNEERKKNKRKGKKKMENLLNLQILGDKN